MKMGQLCLDIISVVKLAFNIFENADLEKDPVTRKTFFLSSSQLAKYFFGSKCNLEVYWASK
jgi:hypothetical protein